MNILMTGMQGFIGTHLKNRLFLKGNNITGYDTKIGKDISIITFDGALVKDLSSPPITAVSFPVKELGKRAINILLNKSKSKNVSDNYLAKTEIIERGSVHIVS